MGKEKALRFNLKKAARAQQRLATRLLLTQDVRKTKRIAGADFSYHKKKGLIGAVVVVLKFPELEIIEVVDEIRDVRIPYIPGYLNFREGPAFVRAFLKLKDQPDITLIDGNGIAHPRRMGLASFVGVVLDIPTIGCAKSPFFPFDPPAENRGAYSLYKDRKNEMVGFCLRTRTSVKPIFVSPGHKVDFVFSRDTVLACSKFRIPEPVRIAHRMAKELFSGFRIYV
jgi:deoxyribonuclease V